MLSVVDGAVDVPAADTPDPLPPVCRLQAASIVTRASRNITTICLIGLPFDGSPDPRARSDAAGRSGLSELAPRMYPER